MFKLSYEYSLYILYISRGVYITDKKKVMRTRFIWSLSCHKTATGQTIVGGYLPYKCEKQRKSVRNSLISLLLTFPFQIMITLCSHYFKKKVMSRLISLLFNFLILDNQNTLLSVFKNGTLGELLIALSILIYSYYLLKFYVPLIGF